MLPFSKLFFASFLGSLRAFPNAFLNRSTVMPRIKPLQRLPYSPGRGFDAIEYTAFVPASVAVGATLHGVGQPFTRTKNHRPGPETSIRCLWGQWTAGRPRTRSHVGCFSDTQGYELPERGRVTIVSTFMRVFSRVYHLSTKEAVIQPELLGILRSSLRPICPRVGIYSY